jgi:TonB family protein
MQSGQSVRTSQGRKRWATLCMQIFAAALVLNLALPAHAGDDRAVKLRVAPVYPEIAKRMKISGEVKLEATVEADGTVKDVKAVSGNHILGEAAEEAVRKWKFEAANGETTVTVAVNFAL